MQRREVRQSMGSLTLCGSTDFYTITIWVTRGAVACKRVEYKRNDEEVCDEGHKGVVDDCDCFGNVECAGAGASDANTRRPVTDDDIAVLRQDVQADKTEIITRNMQFTEDQSKAFWPVYRNYAHDQQVIGDQRVALIKDYAANYDSMDDARAQSYIARA